MAPVRYMGKLGCVDYSLGCLQELLHFFRHVHIQYTLNS